MHRNVACFCDREYVNLCVLWMSKGAHATFYNSLKKMGWVFLYICHSLCVYYSSKLGSQELWVLSVGQDPKKDLSFGKGSIRCLLAQMGQQKVSKSRPLLYMR